MTTDPASLDNLRDLAEPPAVPWYPFAPGWWVLIGIAFAAMLYFGIRAWLTWKKNAYRRAALAELQAGGDLARHSEVLKRTALVAFPRTEIACLTGGAWCQWLEKTGKVSMSDQVKEAFTTGIYRAQEPNCPKEVVEFSQAWISNHQPDELKGGTGC